MALVNEYRHILNGNENFITKGIEMTKHLIVPNGYSISDALLYQVGAGQKTIGDVQQMLNELSQWVDSKIK